MPSPQSTSPMALPWGTVTFYNVTYTEAKGALSPALETAGFRVPWTVRKSKLCVLFATQSEMHCVNSVLMDTYSFEKARVRGPVPLCWKEVRFGPGRCLGLRERRLRAALTSWEGFPSGERVEPVRARERVEASTVGPVEAEISEAVGPSQS